MHIYFSGIGGVGLGPLAHIVADAGYDVSGSDAQTSLTTTELVKRGLDVHIGQEVEHIATVHAKTPIDWFVHTAALPPDHPELAFAAAHNIRVTKRDELLAQIISEKNLKLIAVAGTHGKTSTTGLLVWAMTQLGVPVSYSVGTTLSFGPSGHYDTEGEFFVYECDEFDRNMLHFQPHLSLITSLDYDHPDTYPTPDDYKQAFGDFLSQSDFALMWEKDYRYLGADPIANLEAYDELMDLSHLKLIGDHTRHNAYLVERALTRLLPEVPPIDIQSAINTFPGVARRMEKLADNLYSDYGHHPAEIAATLQLAKELSDHIVLVYQPHQNVRQHEVKTQYTDCFQAAEKIYWLPTYLSRENPALPVLSPRELTASLTNRDDVSYAEMNDELWRQLETHRENGELVLLMGAGDIDGWARQRVAATK